jgi:hypothetical protein
LLEFIGKGLARGVQVAVRHRALSPTYDTAMSYFGYTCCEPTKQPLSVFYQGKVS